jgi:hypothetical protein
MTDSALVMISMTYDPRGETIRFVSRKIRFALAAFGLLEAGNETEASFALAPEASRSRPGKPALSPDLIRGLSKGSARRLPSRLEAGRNRRKSCKVAQKRT